MHRNLTLRDVEKALQDTLGDRTLRVSTDTPLFSLGLDSLDLVEMALHMEVVTGKATPEGAEERWTTPAEVIKTFETAKSYAGQS